MFLQAVCREIQGHFPSDNIISLSLSSATQTHLSELMSTADNA